MPPAPWTITPRFLPSRINASAIGSSMSRRYTPVICTSIGNGLASGPTRLKMVGVAMLFRTSRNFPSAGWIAGANKNAIPVWSSNSGIIAGSAVVPIPSSSSTSALPVLLETLRLPCFATFMPQPASTNAVSVLILKLNERSPPVPHTSISSPSVFGKATAFERIAFTRPTISSAVSPLACKATRNSLISWSSIRPSNISIDLLYILCSLKFSARLIFISPQLFWNTKIPATGNRSGCGDGFKKPRYHHALMHFCTHSNRLFAFPFNAGHTSALLISIFRPALLSPFAQEFQSAPTSR